MRHRLFGYCTAPLALVGLSLGCDTGIGTSTPTVSTTAGLVTGLAQAFCARQVCCGGSATPDDASAPAGSSDGGNVCVADGGAPTGTDGGASCLARAQVAISEQLALVTTAESEGLLVVNSSAATTCIAAYQNLPCSGGSSTIPDVQITVSGCGGLFTGEIPVGERCDMTLECAAASFCLAQVTGQNLTSIAGSSSLGVCYPYEEMGQACNTSADCDPAYSLTCNPVTFLCEPPPS